MAQRAEVLNAMLADLYGEQRLLAEACFPRTERPAWLSFGHAAASSRLKTGGSTFYAVDLARSPDGRWWVIADRTQAHSGRGTRWRTGSSFRASFPELFRDLRVEHLADFFRTLQDSLAGIAPWPPASSRTWSC